MASDMRTRCFFALLLAVRSWSLVVFLSTIAIITFVGICVLAAWLIWEMDKAKGFLQKIRTMHARSDKERQDLLALLAKPTEEDNKDENAVRLKKVIAEYMNMNMKDKKGILIKLKEVVDAWHSKMKDEKGKKSGTAEGQDKKDKNRTGKGQEKDKKSGLFF